MIGEKSRAEQKVKALKVLIADDDPPTRMLLRAAISQWGYEVIEAAHGEQAWQLLQEPEAPRLLILDWLMPQLDGIGLCQRIKELLPFHPYIILLTQVAGTANIVKGLEAGADEFLSKPFNMAELRSRLSVGARIIGYEITISERNKELQHYVEEVESLAQERVREIMHHADLLVMLSMLVIGIMQELYEELSKIYPDNNEAGTQAENMRHIQSLYTSMEQIIEVIKGLQNDSRSMANKVVSGNVADVLNHILTICKPAIKHIKLEKDIQANLPTIKLNIDKVQQVFIALTLDAADTLKSEEDKSLKITASLAHEKMIRVVYEYMGPSITKPDEEVVAPTYLVFNEQNAKSTRLSIQAIKDVLLKMGGNLLVENRPEGGVKFVVDLSVQELKG